MANELEICRSARSFMEESRQWFVELFDRFEGLVSNRALNPTGKHSPHRLACSIATMKIRKAQKGEARLLSDLAMRAKADCGYAAGVLEQWKAELTMSAEDISAHPTFVATIEEEIAGFYLLLPSVAPWTLDHFWVSPEFRDRGIGRCLLAHALETAAGGGAFVVTVDADPHAEGFYVRRGARRLGEVPAPIPEQPKRVRPQLVFHVDATSNG